jgi:A/G-specific adenine glycosylase
LLSVFGLVPPHAPNVKTVVSALLKWFAVSARDLPWRRTRDPYAIWVSEIMLQQTQVKTVLPYWERWMEALPNIRALAKATPEKIHKLWEGLGYYTRVRNMQRAAQIIVKERDSEFPREFDAVLALPGIGRYTAGAICSIAFNQPTPMLDGNVIRVLTRFFGIKGDPREKKTNAKLWRLAEDLVKSVGRASPRAVVQSSNNRRLAGTLVPPGRVDAISSCSHLNQSLMELGALICTPKNPRCADCPLKSNCVAHRKRIVHLLPTIPRRAPATSRRFFAFVINRNSRFLVRQRPAGVVNAHLWEFPNIEINGDTDINKIAQTALGFRPDSLKPARTIKHTITRYRITLDVFHGVANGKNSLVTASDCWLPPRDLRRLPFTSAHKKILADL